MIRPPARALVRRCGPWLALAAVAAVAGRFIPYAGWAALAILVMTLAIVLAWWREGHVQGERALYLREGLFGRRVWIIPYEKLQTVGTRRGPLQRALGLASLVPDTAGAPPFGAPNVGDLARLDAEALAARLLANFYTARARVRDHLTVVEPEPRNA